VRSLFVFLAMTAVAAAQVDVSKPFQKRVVAVNGFAGNAALTEVVRNDVRLSGYLALAKATGGEFVQDGAVRGSTVECTVTHVVTKKVMMAKSYALGSDVRRLGHQISDEILNAITGQRGVAQTKIAFVLQRGKTKELCVMDYDGYNVRQLTRDNRPSTGHPRWSPDGRKLLYTGYVQVFPDIIEVTLATGGRRALVSYPGLNTGAVYSPDGARMALTLSKDGNPELYVANSDGTGLQRLTRTAGAESSPTWSPDGRQIAYVSDAQGSPQIYLLDRDGGTPERLTRTPSYNTEPAWSHPPAGSDMKPMLAVTSRVGGRFQIGLFDSATGAVEPKAADGGDNWDPSWSPNARMLVFSKQQNWRSRLYLLDVVTGEQLELPAVEGSASEPAWGP